MKIMDCLIMAMNNNQSKFNKQKHILLLVFSVFIVLIVMPPEAGAGAARASTGPGLLQGAPESDQDNESKSSN